MSPTESYGGKLASSVSQPAKPYPSVFAAAVKGISLPELLPGLAGEQSAQVQLNLVPSCPVGSVVADEDPEFWEYEPQWYWIM